MRHLSLFGSCFMAALNGVEKSEMINILHMSVFTYITQIKYFTRKSEISQFLKGKVKHLVLLLLHQAFIYLYEFKGKLAHTFNGNTFIWNYHVICSVG